MPSRLFSLVLPIVILSAVSAHADLQQSAYRVGGSFRLESFEDETNADFEAGLGYLLRPSSNRGSFWGSPKGRAATLSAKPAAACCGISCPAGRWFRESVCN